MGGGRRKILLVAGLLTGSCLALFAQLDRAARLLSQAREAVGGETALKTVTSLSVRGTSRSTLDGVPRPFVAPSSIQTATFGNVQVDIELPDKLVIERDWPTAFTRQIGGFNGNELLEQTRGTDGIWVDTPLGEARNDGRALAARARELVRYLLALLLTVPESYQVHFTDAGEEGGGPARADAVEATGLHSFSARLFFDPQNHRPVLLTYSEPPPAASPVASRTAETAGQLLFKRLEAPKDAPGLGGDIRMLVSDYERDDGLLFPHKLKFEMGPLAEEWNITRVTVNPPFEASRFSVRGSK